VSTQLTAYGPFSSLDVVGTRVSADFHCSTCEIAVKP
jgi:hypothetical protein